MLEILAGAHELIDGVGDEKRFDTSLETLSRKTLGQLLHDFRKRADIRSDIDQELQLGLEARNFLIHHFAAHVGDDFNDPSKLINHQKLLYDKMAVVINANTSAAAVLVAIGRAHTEHSERIDAELKQTLDELGNLLRAHALSRH